MRDIISFSLYGSDALYCRGAIENARLARGLYPEWGCRFYCSNDVPGEIVSGLLAEDAEIIMLTRAFRCDGMVWRFYPLNDTTVRRWLSRDADSRLNRRERAAVDEWIGSERTAHIMRDGRNHFAKILGGMFGIDNTLLRDRHSVPDIAEHAKQYATHFTQQKGADQRLLADVLWPLIEDDHLAHDHYGHFHTGHERPFPIANDDTITTYVGQPVPVEPTGPVTDRIRRWVSAELYARQKLGR